MSCIERCPAGGGGGGGGTERKFLQQCIHTYNSHYKKHVYMYAAVWCVCLCVCVCIV